MKIARKDLKKEMKLNDEVYSSLGGVIFNKGTVLNSDHIEIMEAFGVEQINIKDENNVKEDKKEAEPLNKAGDSDKNLFNVSFKKALKVIDNTFKLALGNAQIPIVDLRKALFPLLDNSYQQIKLLFALNFDKNDYLQYDSYHALSVGLISYNIARWKGLDQGERMQVALAGALHDIGMSRIPDYLLFKEGKLSKDEFDEIKRHTYYGYQILKNTKGLSEGARLAVLQHHERENGDGYPLQLKKDNIHPYAKIVAVADIFHAMISKRNYRVEYPPFSVLEQLVKDSFGKLNPEIVQLFVGNMTNFSVGEQVLLNNDKKGIIVFIDQQSPTRPWIKVGDSIINLLNEKQLYIKRIL